MTAAAPHLHDGVPGILALAAVGAAVFVVFAARCRRWARRTVAQQPASPPTIQPWDTQPYDAGHTPLTVSTEGDQ